MRLRIDSCHEDPDLYAMIEEASATVLRYIKYGSVDEDGNPIHDFSSSVPRDIQSATLLIIGELRKEREAGSDPMSQAVIDILTPYRDPTLA